MAYKIAVTLFFLSLGSSLVNSMFAAEVQELDPENDAQLPFAPDQRWVNNMPELSENWNVSQQNVGDTQLNYGDAFGGIALFKALADATVTLWWFVESLGIPAELNLIITGGTYLSYLSAGVFLLTGRDPET